MEFLGYLKKIVVDQKTMIQSRISQLEECKQYVHMHVSIIIYFALHNEIVKARHKIRAERLF